jgi:D-arabinose 1-dehydrogenase-like Zn-dependent alcohol dehydrogenase
LEPECPVPRAFRIDCGAHSITADVEVIPIQKVNEAYGRMLKADVKYRFSDN